MDIEDPKMKRLALLLFVQVAIVFSCPAQLKTLPFEDYIQIRKGLSHSYHCINQDEKITIAFLGGSITYNEGWRNMICKELQIRYPDTRFRFISAGIPSLGSLPHAFRLQRDVLDSGKVDLLFLESAVNDQVNGTDSVTQIRSLEGIIRQARTSNPKMDIVMMSFADPEKTEQYNQGHTPLSVKNHELIATHYGLPSINLAKAVRDKLKNKEFDWDRDFKDLHPSPFGQDLYFQAIKTLFNLSIQSAKVKVSGKAFKLPVALDKASFTNGRYLSINKANLLKGWKTIEDWSPKDQLGTRDGFVHIPVLEADSAGSLLTLKFEGSAIGMAVVSGGDAGIVTYRIDSGPEKQIDLFTAWSNSLHLPWYVLFDGNLKSGKHVLSLSISERKNSSSKAHACRIVNFLLN